MYINVWVSVVSVNDNIIKSYSEKSPLANRNVLRFFLNISKLLLFLVWFGSLFQSVSPATLKDLPANICLTVLGVTSLSFMLLDLGLWFPLEHLTSRFIQYSGASPLRHLNTSTRILNLILDFMGSQCSSANASLLLEYLLLPSTGLAE